MTDVTGEIQLGAEHKLERWRTEGGGCGIRGMIEMHKVDGEFHVAMGRETHELPNFARFMTPRQKQVMGHMHMFDDAEMIWFNTSHVINHLQFVDLSSHCSKETQPLDGVRMFSPGKTSEEQARVLHRYMYLIRVVPTIRVSAEGSASLHYEYTYKFLDYPVEVSTEMKIHPGVFFQYTVSPYHVVQTSMRLSAREALNRFFAIISGIAVLASFLFSFWDFIFSNMKEFVDSLSHPRGVHPRRDAFSDMFPVQQNTSMYTPAGQSLPGANNFVPDQPMGTTVPKSKSYLSQTLGLASHVD